MKNTKDVSNRGRNEDQKDSYNKGITVSNRLKKCPTTGRDDFLWA
jgi:hypothetical protein